jgi:hypothetical protein
LSSADPVLGEVDLWQHRGDYPTEYAAITAVARRLGMTPETLRKLLRQAEVDEGTAAGTSTAESAQVRELKRKNREQVLNENAAGRPASEADAINVVDHFILQQPLADGRTVAEVFAAEHPGLTDDDRQVLQGWREVVAGVFEIREQAGDSITAIRLGDDQSYRIRANAGSAVLATTRPGCFMTARIVPIGDDWMLSGAQQLYAASERPAMLRLAADLATGPHAPGPRNEDDQPQVSRG